MNGVFLNEYFWNDGSDDTYDETFHGRQGKDILFARAHVLNDDAGDEDF